MTHYVSDGNITASRVPLTPYLRKQPHFGKENYPFPSADSGTANYYLVSNCSIRAWHYEKQGCLSRRCRITTAHKLLRKLDIAYDVIFLSDSMEELDFLI